MLGVGLRVGPYMTTNKNKKKKKEKKTAINRLSKVRLPDAFQVDKFRLSNLRSPQQEKKIK